MYEQEGVLFSVVELVTLPSMNPFFYDGLGEFASGFFAAVNLLKCIVCKLYLCDIGFTYWTRIVFQYF